MTKIAHGVLYVAARELTQPIRVLTVKSRDFINVIVLTVFVLTVITGAALGIAVN